MEGMMKRFASLFLIGIILCVNAACTFVVDAPPQVPVDDQVDDGETDYQVDLPILLHSVEEPTDESQPVTLPPLVYGKGGEIMIYYPETKSLEKLTGDSSITQIPGYSNYPKISKSGKYIAFVTDNVMVYIYDLENQVIYDQFPIGEVGWLYGNSLLSWVEGDRLAISEAQGECKFDHGGDAGWIFHDRISAITISLYDPQTRNKQYLYEIPMLDNLQPMPREISDNGQYLRGFRAACWWELQPPDNFFIYENTTGRHYRQPDFFDSGYSNTQISISPDSEWFALFNTSSIFDDGYDEIFFSNRKQGGNLITFDSAESSGYKIIADVKWAPDSKHLALMNEVGSHEYWYGRLLYPGLYADTRSELELSILSLEGVIEGAASLNSADITLVASGYAEAIAWSPDSNKLAYSRWLYNEGNSGPHVVELRIFDLVTGEDLLIDTGVIYFGDW